MEGKTEARQGEETAWTRPSLTFYHPNAKGTGCAVQLTLHPAHGDTAGSIFLLAANQMSVGSGSGATRVFPKFDWENRICVKLDFADLCKILQVLRGECESIDDGRGLFHRSAGGSAAIKFRHVVEPTCGYSLEIYRSGGAGGEKASHILFGAAEGLGLCEVISRALPTVCFGVPAAYAAAAQSRASRGKGGENAA